MASGLEQFWAGDDEVMRHAQDANYQLHPYPYPRQSVGKSWMAPRRRHADVRQELLHVQVLSDSWRGRWKTEGQVA